MKIVVCEPNKEPEIKEIGIGLEPMQEVVGGYIECLPLTGHIKGNFVIVCNEEGKLRGLEPNMVYFGDIIVGTFFILAEDTISGELRSLTDEEAEYWQKEMSAR